MGNENACCGPRVVGSEKRSQSNKNNFKAPEKSDNLNYLSNINEAKYN